MVAANRTSGAADVCERKSVDLHMVVQDEQNALRRRRTRQVMSEIAREA